MNAKFWSEVLKGDLGLDERIVLKSVFKNMVAEFALAHRARTMAGSCEQSNKSSSERRVISYLNNLCLVENVHSP